MLARKLQTCIPSVKQVFTTTRRMVHVEAKIAELGFKLPAVNSPKGNYALLSRTGNLIFTAGHLPQPADGELITGKVGKDLDEEDGYKAAQFAALSLLATLKEELGDLDKIEKVVKVVGFVNCVDGFTNQPKVINGLSDLLGDVLGEKGKHARSAVGTNALPLNVPVEVEVVVQVKSD
mmetsp:Transcript_12568/g.14420  ORF Transcript_12568/g.14420 Transcript_12568/m.14420 type:complete len:178 (-) Transcript_12568:115-648(-)